MADTLLRVPWADDSRPGKCQVDVQWRGCPVVSTSIQQLKKSSTVCTHLILIPETSDSKLIVDWWHCVDLIVDLRPQSESLQRQTSLPPGRRGIY